MKKVFISNLVLFLLLTGISCTAQESKSTASATKKIEVYYFHYTNRCMTCNTVEKEAKDAVASLYPQQVASGKIVFKALNLDDEPTKAVAVKCKAMGQSLLVISGDKRVDLTNQGFMYAVNNPDKLKAEIKTTIDGMLK